jgi:Flp pilus assembly protein TadB
MTAHPEPVRSSAEIVIKFCLIISVAVGAVVILLAWIGNRDLLNVSSSVGAIVALQWLFYLLVKRRSKKMGTES